MKLQSQPFKQISLGKKIYELRLYDYKRKLICIGDEIIFTEITSGDTCKVKVVDILLFQNFDELYTTLPLKDCGYDSDSVKNASPSDMEKYYSKEEQSRFRVIAIKIELIS